MPASAPAYPRILPCPRCGIGLAGEAIAPESETQCPSCKARFSAQLFPTFWQEKRETLTHSQPAAEGEASCFFHPENRAAHACDRCGRFVCSVCEITIGASRVCPSCVSVGIADPARAEFVPWRFLWGDGALLLGIVPVVLGIFVWPMLPLSALAALVFAVMAWRRPGSIPRGQRRGAAIVGIIGALVQVAIFAGLVLAISGRLFK